MHSRIMLFTLEKFGFSVLLTLSTNGLSFLIFLGLAMILL